MVTVEYKTCCFNTISQQIHGGNRTRFNVITKPNKARNMMMHRDGKLSISDIWECFLLPGNVTVGATPMKHFI